MIKDIPEEYNAIEEYTFRRIKEKGDIYGWGIQAENKVIILVDPAAEDLPSDINGINITYIRVSEPEAL